MLLLIYLSSLVYLYYYLYLHYRAPIFYASISYCYFDPVLKFPSSAVVAFELLSMFSLPIFSVQTILSCSSLSIFAGVKCAC